MSEALNSPEAKLRRFRSYPKYKASGVEWLGEIPAHWEVYRLKSITKEHKQGFYTEQAYVDEGVKLARITDIDDRAYVHFDNMPYVQIDSKEERAFRLAEGDILFARSGTIGRFGIVYGSERVVFASYLIRFRFRKVNIEFLRYAFDSKYFKDSLVSSLHGGANKNVHAENIMAQSIALPPYDEQLKITAYLLRETAKIDALIEKKARLIELLQEKRTALITQVVTKGLDPNVPMKDSGVEWLGKIPAHWQTFQLRRVIRKFIDYRGKTPEKASYGIPLITARNIKNQMIDFFLSEEYIPESLYIEWMIRGFPERGDVLITTEAPLGESAQVDDPKIALAQRIILLKAEKEKITNDYLKYVFSSEFGRTELLSKATGSTALGIKASHLKELLVTVPPLSEQKAITKKIDLGKQEIVALIAKIREAIERLGEYRTALISAAVTGKIDIRAKG